MKLLEIPLAELRPHPQNSNVMPEPLLAKLVDHLERTGQYPPVIVRLHEDAYQILDGHHRVEALRRLQAPAARCVVWDVDDAGALTLLATLNRLQGQDDPRKRAKLIAKLHGHVDLKTLASRLPEHREQINKLMKLNDTALTPRAPRALGEMPVAIHFFLLPKQRRAVEKRLREVGGSREEALLSLLDVAGYLSETQALSSGD